MVVMSSAQGLPVLALQEGPAAGKEPNPTCSPSALGTASLLCHRIQRELSAPECEQNSSSAPKLPCISEQGTRTQCPLLCPTATRRKRAQGQLQSSLEGPRAEQTHSSRW